MIEPSFRRTTCCVLATLLALGLLATSQAGAVATDGSTHNLAIERTAATAIEVPNETLNVTKTYERDPSDLGNVTVTMTIRNPEILDRPGVHNVSIDAADVEVLDVGPGLVATGQEDTYRVSEGANEAVLRYENAIDRNHELATENVTHVVPTHLALQKCYNLYTPNVTCVGTNPLISVETDGGVDVEPAFWLETSESGFVTGDSARIPYIDYQNKDETPYDPLVVLGNVTTRNATVDGTTVTLVLPAGVDTWSSPGDIANRTAEAAATIDVGNDGERRYVLAAPHLGPRLGNTTSGLTSPAGSRWVKYRSQLPIHNVWGPPVHEYVHTTAGFAGRSDRVIFEGYPTFRAANTSLQQGYGDYDHFRNVLEAGRTVTDGEENAAYYRGVLIFAALDRRIRIASDGANSTADVAARMRNHSGEIGTNDFEEMVAAESTDAVGQLAADWVTSDSRPDTWSLEDHQSVYGPVPDPEYETASIATSSTRGTTTIDSSGPVAVRQNATVAFELSVTNEGDATASYRTYLRAFDGTPYDGPIPEIYDAANGTVAPTGRATATLTHRFESTGHRPVEVGPAIPANHSRLHAFAPAAGYNVTVVPENATIVRQHGVHDDPDHGAIVSPDTGPVVFAANRTAADTDLDDPVFENVYVNDSWNYTTAYGQRVTVPYKDYATNGNGVAVVEDLGLDPGERVEVEFWSREAGDSQYLSVLEPVNGTVPSDVDGDGEYEDLDGDGTLSIRDAVILYEHRNDSAVTEYVPAYDFDDDGDVDGADATALYQAATG